eukprot:COSAG04_NODE_1627_length_6122_cov_4.279761_2_plen_94_part_00
MGVQEAVSAALHAGCDADCGHDYQQGIPPMVANGTIDMQLVDKAVVRVLTNRMMLGELEVYSEISRDSFGKVASSLQRLVIIFHLRAGINRGF